MSDLIYLHKYYIVLYSIMAVLKYHILSCGMKFATENDWH